MRVREAGEPDISGVLGIVNLAIAESHAHFGTTPNTEKDVRAWLGAGERYPFVVVEVEGEVRGFARATPWKEREAYAWTVEIGVYVAGGAQGRGLGRALYAELFPRLESGGFRTVIAGIALPNEPSERLHRSFGMRHVGTLPCVGFKGGRWLDVAYYSRRLGGEGPVE